MQHAPALNCSPSARQVARDGGAGMALRTYLGMNPGIALATWVMEDRAVVDLLRIPDRSRRRGLGGRVYRMWEATLPDGMLVELFAVDMEASAFWRSLGFEGEDNGVMVKRVSRTRMSMAA